MPCHPGYTLTPALKNAIDRGERDVSALAANAALRRLVDPAEIGRVVAFLASDAASAHDRLPIVPVDCGLARCHVEEQLMAGCGRASG